MCFVIAFYLFIYFSFWFWFLVSFLLFVFALRFCFLFGCLFLFFFSLLCFLLFGFGFYFMLFALCFLLFDFNYYHYPRFKPLSRRKARNNKEIIDLGLKQGVLFPRDCKICSDDT